MRVFLLDYDRWPTLSVVTQESWVAQPPFSEVPMQLIMDLERAEAEFEAAEEAIRDYVGDY